MTTRIIQRTIALDQGLLLAQLRPTVVTPVAFYSPEEGIQTETDELRVINLSNSVVEFQVFHDKTGALAGFSESIWLATMAARTSVRLELKAYLTASVETLSVQSSIAGVINYTLYGRETQERAR